MNRRKFVSLMGLGALSAVLPARLRAETAAAADAPKAAPFRMKFAPNINHFKAQSGGDFIRFLNVAHDYGFRAIEDNGMMRRDIALQKKIAKEMERLDMEMGVFVIHHGKDARLMENGLDGQSPQGTLRDFWDVKMQTAIETAKRVRATHITLVPGTESRRLPDSLQFAHLTENLSYCAEKLENTPFVIVLEPLSDSTPDYYLRTQRHAFDICRKVGSPHIKILGDIYHQWRNEEPDVVANIEACWSEIAYFQCGDTPGRCEPGTGKIDFKSLFQKIYDKGYRGIMGMEHRQSQKGRAGDEKLVAAYRLVDPAGR